MTKKTKKHSDKIDLLSFEVFEAGAFDINSITKLFDDYRKFYRQESDMKGAESFLRERIAKKDSVIYIAWDEEGNAAGFTQLYPMFSSVSMSSIWLLNDLFVKPEFRGHGVSRMLISEAKKLARISGSKGLQLETEKTNDIGLKLYPSEGFVLNSSSNFYFWQCD